jgi:hypothetical protein
LANKGLGVLAAKGGLLGKGANIASRIINFGGGGAGTAAVKAAKAATTLSKAGGIGGKFASALGKLGGLGGKATGLLSKAGGLGGKAAGLLGKVGGLGGKAAGVLGKAGGLASKLGPALGGVAKFAGPIGIALAAAQAVGGGVKGWKNAAQIAGLEEGKEATTGQKVGSAVSGGLSALTLGLLKPEMIYGAGKKIGNTFKSAFGKEEYELNEDGTPKLDENGKPVVKKRGMAANILRNSLPGLAIRGAQTLFDKDKRKEAFDKLKGFGNKLFGKEEYELNEDGTPKLDENGNPIKKSRGLVANILRNTPAGLTVRGAQLLFDKDKRKAFADKLFGKKEKTGIDGDDIMNAESMDEEDGKGKKKKSIPQLLQDIHDTLVKGIMVFPSGLSKENSPEHLKKTVKQGLFQAIFSPDGKYTIGGERKSLFGHGKSAVSNAVQWVKDSVGAVVNKVTGREPSSSQSQQSASYPSQGNNNSTSTGNYQSQNANLDFDKINGPQQASLFFYNNASQVGNQLENMLANGEYDKIENLADRIKDPSSMGQNKNIDSLSPEFGSRVRNFLNSPEAIAKGVSIREAGRSPLTQLAYFTPGRATDESFIHRMYKKAGFANGAWNTKMQVTQTMGSKHFTGNAIDIEDHGKGVSYYKEIAPIAKKYGLSWGGDWNSFKDYPHFELPQDDKEIGYNGPPKEDKVPEEATMRADGIGDRYGRVQSISGLQRSNTVNSMTQRRSNGFLGQTTSSSIRLSESPIITSEKMLISQINNAIDIQKAIHEEQKRHNNVAEDFFISIIKVLQEMPALKGASSQGLTESQIREINSLSSLMEKDRMAKEHFSRTARQMAEGF